MKVGSNWPPPPPPPPEKSTLKNASLIRAKFSLTVYDSVILLKVKPFLSWGQEIKDEPFYFFWEKFFVFSVEFLILICVSFQDSF